MALQVLGKKPASMLELPGPWIVPLPALLNSCLHEPGLPEVSLLCSPRSRQYAAQKQRHIKRFAHDRPPI